MVCYNIHSCNFFSFFKNKLFKLFLSLGCYYTKLQFGITICSIEVSKQKLCVTRSLYVFNKLSKEIHPAATPFSRAKDLEGLHEVCSSPLKRESSEVCSSPLKRDSSEVCSSPLKRDYSEVCSSLLKRDSSEVCSSLLKRDSVKYAAL